MTIDCWMIVIDSNIDTAWTYTIVMNCHKNGYNSSRIFF